jgi:serine phosphatase RsbU (regulator of sigma subunit)
MTDVSITTEGALPAPRPGPPPGAAGRPLLREEALRPWLAPLAAATGLSFVLNGPDGRVIMAEGAWPGETARHVVRVRGSAIAELVVPAGTGEAVVAAVCAALASFAESREAITDFSRSLATAWKESNFLYDLAQMLRDVVDVDAAAAIVVGQLARVQRAEQVALALREDGGWTAVASPPEALSDAASSAEAWAAAGLHEPGVEWVGDRCAIHVPLLEGDEVLGVLMLTGPAALAHAANMQFLANVGSQIAQAIRLRYLIQARIDAAQLRRELELGAELQRNLLPQAPPAYPGVSLAGTCRPAQLVGGDGLDYHVHAAGLDLVIADVSGHGLAAGLLMSSYLGMMRTLELAPRTPAELAAIANRRICREVGLSGQYVTACHARLSPDRRRLTYAVMGHPAPLLWRGGVVEPLPGAAGLPAGLAEEGRFGEVSVEVMPGDVVVFYTDGLVEARSPEGAMFGREGLMEAIAGAPRAAPDLIAHLFAACEAFTGGQSPLDDQTAIVLHVQHQE